WQGTKIPDHGEVWSLAWKPKIEGETLTMTTYGVRFPYKLEKRIWFTAANILRTEYTLTNLSAFDFNFLWAAHTMINLENGVELVLPAAVTRAVSCSAQGSLGRYSEENDWPRAKQPDGSIRDLSKLRPITTRNSEK